MNPPALPLRVLIDELEPVRFEGSLDRTITGLAYDSRRVTPGMAFFALRGQNVDGHDFVASAIDRGAAAIICEENGFSSQRATKIKVKDARVALARAAAVFYEHPSRKMRIVGITGTNGKTTVSFALAHLLRSAGQQCGLMGTVRYEMGDRVIPAQRTTPEALEVQQMFAQMLRAGSSACVMEVSSHALAQQRVHQVAFDFAVFTNLTQDHLDFHGTMEDYYQAKRRLFQGLASDPCKHGRAIVNADDPWGQRLLRELPDTACTTFGLDATAQVRAAQFDLGPDHTRLTCSTPAGSCECRLPLIGRHNVVNALAAVATALQHGLSLDQIRQGLENLAPVPGRLERVDQGQPFELFVDYAHTDDALRHVLTTLRELTRGRLLLAFGCGGSRDTGKRAKMGQVAAELADFTWITSDNPRKESPFAIACCIEDGFRQAGSNQYQVELDRRRAIDGLLRVARPGDTLLIAGKGHETYQEFSDIVVPFDDRTCARETLAALGYQEGFKP
jgi:UDP-N-acetylmuramoyl-L-alanyl-D-glutamate--2,6-diaminopimelate ligase